MQLLCDIGRGRGVGTSRGSPLTQGHCRVISSVLGLYPWDASSDSPVVISKTVFLLCPVSLGGVSSLVESPQGTGACQR